MVTALWSNSIISLSKILICDYFLVFSGLYKAAASDPAPVRARGAASGHGHCVAYWPGGRGTGGWERRLYREDPQSIPAGTDPLIKPGTYNPLSYTLSWSWWWLGNPTIVFKENQNIFKIESETSKLSHYMSQMFEHTESWQIWAFVQYPQSEIECHYWAYRGILFAYV